MSNTNVRQNWFETLSQALESEGLEGTWSCFNSISYGETVRYCEKINGVTNSIVISRDDKGRYERPIHYKCI